MLRPILVPLRCFQEDACEAKDHLRIYVKDFLLWRDRAKRLEARAEQLGRPEEPAEVEPPAQQQRHRLEDIGPETLATATGSADAGSAESDTGGGAVARLSIPENYARYFGTTPTSASFVDAHNKPQEESNGGQEEAGAAAPAGAVAAAAAWSTRSMIAGSPSASSRQHFQRSMAAQQAISVRLERDLAKARADLQSIHAGSRTNKGGGVKAMGVGFSPRQEERASMNSSEGALDETDGDDNQTPPDNSSREDKDSGGGGGSAPVEDTAGEAVKSSVVGGPYMARVLAALLGGEPTAEVEVGRAPSQSLRLADFPPALQAVFGQGQATAPRILSSDGAQTENSGDSVTRQQARSWSRRAAATEAPERRGNPVGIDETQVRFVGRAASGESGMAVHPVASAADRLGVDRGGRKAGRWEQGLNSGAGGAETASGIAGGLETGLLAGAFRGYEAKSPLLQRWLVERAAPSLSQPDDADRDAEVCTSHAEGTRRGLG